MHQRPFFTITKYIRKIDIFAVQSADVNKHLYISPSSFRKQSQKSAVNITCDTSTHTWNSLSLTENIDNWLMKRINSDTWSSSSHFVCHFESPVSPLPPLPLPRLSAWSRASGTVFCQFLADIFIDRISRWASKVMCHFFSEILGKLLSRLSNQNTTNDTNLVLLLSTGKESENSNIQVVSSLM